jgi:hypothetical protein
MGTAPPCTLARKPAVGQERQSGAWRISPSTKRCEAGPQWRASTHPVFEFLKEISMHPASLIQKTQAHSLPHKPHRSPSEEADADEEDLELPVNPDQGAPLAPDEDGQIQAPA